MININNFKYVLKELNFIEDGDEFYKKFDDYDCELRVDFKNSEIIYPQNSGLIVNEPQTSNFSANENFVVFECVHRLLLQGYPPKSIELEPKWQLGHGASGGRADILIKTNEGKSHLIIECKTAGNELKKAWSTTQTKPTQIFSYARQETSTKFIALYASDYIDSEVVDNYFLISLKDNEQLLTDNEKLKSFATATSVEELYEVWSETYHKDYATLGLFEKNRPYDIGKNKYNIEDLKLINSKDIQNKYHQFATILRQHNVSGRENAFDKLVSLFLCKIVDEAQNPEELQFYYKGHAFDSPFELQDRLQRLYKIGMSKFLKEDITYIDNQSIDDAFNVFKNKPNATKDVIKGYFKELKFFTNNDFAFLDVHNEKLFHKNFEILLKILKLFQDIKLTGSEENQFLGDMFEGFLDQGVKQSEGQFFTPMPIVKFIVNSLPKKDNSRVIDYACGAGHFLNEYARVNNCAEVVGVEKEYRLSKVAKVSSFMYNQEINIIYADALGSLSDLKNNSFDALVANPPYSVKGFLETLTTADREKFELTTSIDKKSYTANNAIECFFIERSLQLLKSGGDAGIIVPSSILSKGSHKINTKSKNTYVQTRELILKYFDIIAIAEFGTGTFGKTGTNTVTLFLKRKEQKPNVCDHLQNMINTWFSGDEKTNDAFKDESVLEEYLNHMEYNKDDYKEFLSIGIPSELSKTQIFQDYKESFIQLTETKSRKKQASYKRKSKKEQEEIELLEFYQFTKSIEKEKLYYFALAYSANQEVVIIKAPSDNKESKKFLGYDWSGRKGNEGIKYLSETSVIIDEDLEDEEKRILENLQSLSNINTPLYNPNDRYDERKISTLVAKNFSKEEFYIPSELDSFVSRSKLVDMLDFSRSEFNKSISLNPNKKMEVIGKPEWQVKLGDVVEIKIGGTPSRKNSEYFNGKNLWVSISEMNGGVITSTKEKITDKGVKDSNVKLIPKGTTLLSFKLSIGKTAIAGDDLYTNEAIAGLIPREGTIKDEYLFHLFNGKIIDLEKDGFNTFGKSLNSAFLKENVRIPLPPIDIQERIINASKIIDIKVDEAKKTIQKNKLLINEALEGVNGHWVKLKDITSKIGSGATPKGGESSYKESGVTLIRSQNIYDGLFKVKGLSFIDNEQARKLDVANVEEGDVLFNITGASVARCCVVETKYLPARVNQHVAIIRPTKEVHPKYLQLIITSKENKEKLVKIASSSTTREAITKTELEEYKIPMIPFEEQLILIKKVQVIESKINLAEEEVVKSFSEKISILKELLK